MLSYVKKIITVLLLLSISKAGHGQQIFFQDPAFYITATSTESDETMPVRTSDGRVLFFLRSPTTAESGKQLSPSVWRTEQVDHVWTAAEKMEKDWYRRNIKAIIGVTFSGDKVFLLGQNSRRGWVKILTSSYHDQRWSKPTLLFKYKKASWQSGAYVDSSENLIVFPMRGIDSYGKEDLYAVTRDSSGRWSGPMNLGATVNTPGTEIAPFLYQRNLFFASDGHPGFGDLDIFSARQLYDSWKIWSAPSNAGNKINSPSHEAFMSLYDDGEVYFSSEQEGQKDVFRTAYRTVYMDTARFYESSSEGEEPDITALRKLLQDEKGLVLFDLNSDQLATKYKELLFYLYNTVRTNTNVTITLIGHADQEGSENYNTTLSWRRAVSVRNFLVSLGIEKERVNVVARGEDDPLVREFSKEARRKNRRVQIVLEESESSFNNHSGNSTH